MQSAVNAASASKSTAYPSVRTSSRHLAIFVCVAVQPKIDHCRWHLVFKRGQQAHWRLFSSLLWRLQSSLVGLGPRQPQPPLLRQVFLCLWIVYWTWVRSLSHASILDGHSLIALTHCTDVFQTLANAKKWIHVLWKKVWRMPWWSFGMNMCANFNLCNIP